jgi:hypothetical protein
MRLLFFNIKFFTQSRVNDASGATAAAQLDNQQRSQANLNYIVSTVNRANADVFVVIEVRTKAGQIMTLAPGKGPPGLLDILNALRGPPPQTPWYLVPPLRINPRKVLETRTYTETMGVFWRNDRVTFQGPLFWPLNAAGTAPSPTGPPVIPGSPNIAAGYPAPWNAAVPPGTNQAAWCRFFNHGQEVEFIHDVSRRPYITDFLELATGRTIRVISVHLSPNVTAQAGLARIVGLPAPVWVPAPGNVTAIAGDFNIDLRNTGTGEETAVAYMRENGFSLLRPYPIPGGVPPPSRYLEVGDATADAYYESQLYDFVFARWGAGAKPNPYPYFPSVVVDRVRGVRSLAPLPEPQPFQEFGDDMLDGLDQILHIMDDDDRNQTFRIRDNFGHIGPPVSGTSDHLPVLSYV